MSTAALENLLQEIDMTYDLSDLDIPAINPGRGLEDLETELNRTSVTPVAATSPSSSSVPSAEEVLSNRHGTIQKMWQTRDQVTSDEGLAKQLQDEEIQRYKHRKDFVAVKEGIQADKALARSLQTNQPDTTESPPIANPALVDEVADRLRKRLERERQMAARQQSEAVPPPSTPVEQPRPASSSNASDNRLSPAAADSDGVRNNRLTIRRTVFYQHGSVPREQQLAQQMAAVATDNLSDEEDETTRAPTLPTDDDDDLPVSSPPTSPPAGARQIPASSPAPLLGSARSASSSGLISSSPSNGSLINLANAGSSSNLSTDKQREIESQLRSIEKEIMEWRYLFRQSFGFFPQYKDLLEDKTKKNMKKRMQQYRDLRRKLLAFRTTT